MTIDYEAAKRALIATRRQNVAAAIDELVYDAERSAADAWANYNRAKDRIIELEAMLAARNRDVASLLKRIDEQGTMP